MTIDVTLKNWMDSTGLLADYIIQPMVWRDTGVQSDRFLVVQPQSSGTRDSEQGEIPVRMLLVGRVGDMPVLLKQLADSIIDAALNQIGYDNIWEFDAVGNPFYMETEEQRPVIEFNLNCRMVYNGLVVNN